MDSPEKASTGRPIDATRLKALAHPLRLEMLEHLLDVGPATASSLGRSVGESSGTTSYHLRRLADAGLIEEASDIGTGRDRHWRAVTGWSLQNDLFEAPATRGDARMVVDEVTRRNADRLWRWAQDIDGWPTPWREAALQANTRLVLTRKEMADLGADLLAVIDSYRDRHPRGAPGTAVIIAQANVFPTGETPPADVPPADVPSDRPADPTST